MLRKSILWDCLENPTLHVHILTVFPFFWYFRGSNFTSGRPADSYPDSPQAAPGRGRDDGGLEDDDEEEEEEILGSDDDEQEDPKDYVKGIEAFNTQSLHLFISIPAVVKRYGHAEL